MSIFDRYDIDILAVNETWLRPGQEGRAPTVPGYRLRHICRPHYVCSGRGGGVGFYVRQGVKVCERPHSADPRFNIVEQMWLTLTLNGKKIAIGTAYRPPRLNLDLFLDAITDTVSSLGDVSHRILLGDFNVNLLNPNDSKTIKLNECLTCLDLSQLITSPTHFTDSSESLIDLVCADLAVKSITVASLGSSIIGHSVLVCEFKLKRNKFTPFISQSRSLKHLDYDKFQHDISLLDWSQWYNLPTLNAMVLTFNQKILSVLDFHAPVRYNVVRKPAHPWVTDTIKLMMQLRDDALHKYRKTKTDLSRQQYKEYKGLVIASLVQEKKCYFRHNIDEKINNPKLLWRNLHNTLIPFNKKRELPSDFSDPDVINSHFLNVPGNLVANNTYIAFFESNRYGDATFNIEQVSGDVISRLLSKLKSNAEGYDGISLKTLFLTLPHTLEFITGIINKSIESSVFPDVWKISTVLPLPKISNPVQIKDLRPISILPCLSKVLEKVVCLQLTEYLEGNGIFPDMQSGFRKGRSTTTALVDVTDNILADQDKGLCTVLVLLDFSRAFDAINTDLLIAKMKYYGFEHNTVLWFQSYLSNRKQFVKLTQNSGNHKTSALKPVTRGVPQGSILGPILFILYCADIVNCFQKCRYHIFADDVQVYISFPPENYESAIKILNEELSAVAMWADNNCLVLNPSKTKYMVFGTKKMKNLLPDTLNIAILSEPIDRVDVARNLGLNMDAALRFEKHIAETVQNCFYRLRVLYPIRPFISEDLRIRLTESLILSKLNYADIVYGPRLLARTNRLIQRVQNACARFCFSIPRRSHITPFLNEHYILKMKSRRKLHLASLLFGVIRTGHPAYLYNRLVWLNCRRLCSVQLATQQHRSASFRGSFRYAASKIWNNIPPPIRNSTSIYVFRKRLRQHLTDAQRELGNINIDMSYI